MRHLLLVFALLHGSLACAESFKQVVITQAGPADVLEVVETAPLPQPGPGEVRLRVIAASASFTDIIVRKGLYPGIDAQLPYPPGYDLVGVVDKLGPGVSGLAIGQRVADMTIWGAYTEYAIRPAAGLVPVPDELPADDAVVLVLSYLTAYQMLFREARLQPGQAILIHGASGAVGTALAQLGRVAGLTMYGTASKSKHEYVRAMGVTPIDYRSEDFVEVIRTATGGHGVQAAFDAISAENFARSYSILDQGGLLVEYGLYTATLEGKGILDLIQDFLAIQWLNFKWSWFPEQDRRYTFYNIADMREEHPQWFKEDLASLFELALEGNIKPLIWKRMPLAAAAEAHRYIEAGEVKGKIVLQVSADPAFDNTIDSPGTTTQQ